MEPAQLPPTHMRFWQTRWFAIRVAVTLGGGGGGDGGGGGGGEGGGGEGGGGRVRR